jgi:hypothetical protein
MMRSSRLPRWVLFPNIFLTRIIYVDPLLEPEGQPPQEGRVNACLALEDTCMETEDSLTTPDCF